MRTLNIVSGAVLVVFAGLHLFIPSHMHFAAVYGAGAALALVSVVSNGTISANVARVLALCTTVAMFFYFAGFFKMASGFEEQWYRTGAALEGIGFLLAAFMMIPTLSCYSCLLKAEGCEQFRENSEAEGAERGSFFGVPEDIQNHS